MDSSLHPPHLTRLLTLNTEAHELRSELMRQPVNSTRIAELQENLDRCHRASLATCWMSQGYELDQVDDDEDLAA